MSINFKKSGGLRIGPRYNAPCMNILSSTGIAIPWIAELRYLGVTLQQSHAFRCSLVQAKKSFYRAANAIFGNIGRVASEEVVLQLLKTKCMPILLYGLEAIPLYKYQLNALDFVINRFFMKLFRTADITLVMQCQEQFGFDLPSVQLARRSHKFLNSMHK